MKYIIMITMALTMGVLSAYATPPGIISYQGRLMTPAGNPVPDGDYSVWFRFYTEPVGGILMHSEAKTVSTEDGLFTVYLGDLNEISALTFMPPAIYLGLSIEGEPEMPTRTRICSEPYALQAQHVVGSYDGKTRIMFYPFSSVRSQLYMIDTAGRAQVSLVQEEAANSITVRQPGTSNTGIKGLVSGDEIALTMYNLNGIEAVRISSLESGNSAARLPDSSISSVEMMNEPGLACNDNSATVVLSTTMSDIVTVTLNAPSNGYVLVNGKGTAFVSGSGSTNYGYVQIDTASGGTADAPYRVAFGSDDMWTGLNVYVPLAASRVFYVNSGSYTFRLEGRTSSSQGAGASLDVRNSMIQAVFIPTSYGTISTLVSTSEAGQFEEAEAIQVEGATKYRVDMRELELKAVRAEAEAERARANAERAQRELLEAKYESAPDERN